MFGSISVIGESKALFAVCKPPSMPMHPCGAYRHNSLEYIVKSDPALLPKEDSSNLLLVHRLDR